MAADGGVHKVGAAPVGKTGDRAGGSSFVEGSLAGILWREARALPGEAGAQESDVVDCRLFGGENDAGRSVSFGDDITGGG